jgi:hypothetical protein
MRIGVSTAGTVPGLLYRKNRLRRFFGPCLFRPAAKSVVFAAWGAA